MHLVWWKEHGGHGDTEGTEMWWMKARIISWPRGDVFVFKQYFPLRVLRVSVPSVSFPVTPKSGSHV